MSERIASQRAAWCPPGRRLHVVDADNLAGTPCPTVAEIRGVHDAYRAVLRPGPADQTVVACSHQSGVEVGLEWPGTQLLWRSGPDGADLVLLDALQPVGDVARRFAGLVIASGDGIFAPAARSIRASGLPVVVAVGEGSLSRELACAASLILDIFEGHVVPRPGASRLSRRGPLPRPHSRPAVPAPVDPGLVVVA